MLLWASLGLAKPPREPLPKPPVVRRGEAYTFGLRFLGSVDAGRARLSISPPSPRDAEPVVRIEAEAEALGLAKAITGLHEHYQLVLSAQTLLPRTIVLHETGWRVRKANISIEGNNVHFAVERPSGRQNYSVLVPQKPLEPLSVLLLLRALKLAQGDQIDLVLLDGSSFYEGTMQVVGKEEVTTPIGRHAAIKIACRGERITVGGKKLGKPPRFGIVWVSDDSIRLPLRIEGETELGRAEFVLTSFDRGNTPLPLPKQPEAMTVRPAPPDSADHRPAR